MLETPFDPTPYIRAPLAGFLQTLAVSRALLAAAPDAGTPSLEKAKRRLERAIKAADAAYAGRQRRLGAAIDSESRAVDALADGGWGALRDRLAALAALPADDHPRAERAALLLKTLFHDEGLAFTRETYPGQWTAMGSLLERIKSDRLAPEIDELAGPEYLRHLKDVQERYGAMVQEMLRREKGSSENLAEHLVELRGRITDYAVQVCATVDHEDPKTVKSARSALRPLDQLRAASKRSGGNTSTPDAEVAVETPAVDPSSPGEL